MQHLRDSHPGLDQHQHEYTGMQYPALNRPRRNACPSHQLRPADRDGYEWREQADRLHGINAVKRENRHRHCKRRHSYEQIEPLAVFPEYAGTAR